MKRFLVLVIFFIISAFVLPVMVIHFTDNRIWLYKAEDKPSKDTVKVFLHKENEVKLIGVEDYLIGVVAAEMPAEFNIEALKAQAVAARSYTYNRKSNPASGHNDTDVCTDHTHCKAYKTTEELKEGWGENYPEYIKKIQNAVNSTKGEVLTYNGEVALAVFHSQAGGGRTENSKDVWGGDVPYLVSVESHGEEVAPNFYTVERFAFENFIEKIKIIYPEFNMASSTDFGEPILSEGGNVREIRIGNTTFKGEELRNIFKLRSSCFEISNENNEMIFEVIGYGHGVGMSQYGANAMANEGADYVEILMHYYTGTHLDNV